MQPVFGFHQLGLGMVANIDDRSAMALPRVFLEFGDNLELHLFGMISLGWRGSGKTTLLNIEETVRSKECHEYLAKKRFPKGFYVRTVAHRRQERCRPAACGSAKLAVLRFLSHPKRCSIRAVHPCASGFGQSSWSHVTNAVARHCN